MVLCNESILSIIIQIQCNIYTSFVGAFSKMPVPCGSFHFKSPRGGRRHGPDFVHIQYLITIRYTKTKSEVLGQIMT